MTSYYVPTNQELRRRWWEKERFKAAEPNDRAARPCQCPADVTVFGHFYPDGCKREMP